MAESPMRAIPKIEIKTKTMHFRGGKLKSPPKPAHSIEEIFCGKRNSRETFFPPDLGQPGALARASTGKNS